MKDPAIKKAVNDLFKATQSYGSKNGIAAKPIALAYLRNAILNWFEKEYVDGFSRIETPGKDAQASKGGVGIKKSNELHKLAAHIRSSAAAGKETKQFIDLLKKKFPRGIKKCWFGKGKDFYTLVVDDVFMASPVAHPAPRKITTRGPSDLPLEAEDVEAYDVSDFFYQVEEMIYPAYEHKYKWEEFYKRNRLDRVEEFGYHTSDPLTEKDIRVFPEASRFLDHIIRFVVFLDDKAGTNGLAYAGSDKNLQEVGWINNGRLKFDDLRSIWEALVAKRGGDTLSELEGYAKKQGLPHKPTVDVSIDTTLGKYKVLSQKPRNSRRKSSRTWHEDIKIGVPPKSKHQAMDFMGIARKYMDTDRQIQRVLGIKTGAGGMNLAQSMETKYPDYLRLWHQALRSLPKVAASDLDRFGYLLSGRNQYALICTLNELGIRVTAY